MKNNCLRLEKEGLDCYGLLQQEATLFPQRQIEAPEALIELSDDILASVHGGFNALDAAGDAFMPVHDVLYRFHTEITRSGSSNPTGN